MYPILIRPIEENKNGNNNFSCCEKIDRQFGTILNECHIYEDGGHEYTSQIKLHIAGFYIWRELFFFYIGFWPAFTEKDKKC